MIPTVDFSSCGLLVNDSSLTLTNKENAATQLISAFSSIGFCYLVNHGIPQSSVDGVFKVSRMFFEQTTTTKLKYARLSNSNHGWAALEREKLNPERPADLKESFNCQSSESLLWPDDEVPEMKPKFLQFLESCMSLSYRILDLLSVGLKLEVVGSVLSGDKDFFFNCHRQIGKRKGSSTLRSLFYPCLPDDCSMTPGQIRCGEHSDYGTLTILFQDDIGGLEVQNSHGVYTDVKPLSGAVLVNIGDLLQRWTSDRLKATKHRVLIPEQENKKRKCRQSIAFFVHPDDDFVVKCLDDSDIYKPITNKEYLDYKFGLSY